MRGVGVAGPTLSGTRLCGRRAPPPPPGSFPPLSYLHRTDSEGTHDYLCNRLFDLPDADVEAVLPQLVTLALARPDTRLASSLARLCSRSLSLGAKCYWLALAASEGEGGGGGGRGGGGGGGGARGGGGGGGGSSTAAAAAATTIAAAASSLRDACERAALEGTWEPPFRDGRLLPLSPGAGGARRRRAGGALSPVFRSRLASPGAASPPMSPTESGGLSRPASPAGSEPLFSDDGSASGRASRRATRDSEPGGSARAPPRGRWPAGPASPPPADGALSPDGRPLSPGGVDRGFFSAISAGLEGLMCASPPPAEGGRGAAAAAAAARRAPAARAAPRPPPLAPPGESGGAHSPPASPRLREATYGATLDLVEALTDAASALAGFSPDDRLWALRRGLADINRELDEATAAGVAVWWPLGAAGGAAERVVRLVPSRARLLASRDKAPFLLLLEVLASAPAPVVAAGGASPGRPRVAALGPPPGLCPAPRPPPPPAPAPAPWLDAQLAAALDGLVGRGPLVRVVLAAARPPSGRATAPGEERGADSDPSAAPVRVKLVPVAPAGPAAGAPGGARRHRRVPSDEALSAVASAAAAAAAGRAGGAGALAAALADAAAGVALGGGAAGAPPPTPAPPRSPHPPDPAATAAALAIYGEPWRDVEAAVRADSPHGRRQGWGLRRAIVKSGDDCRQELLAAQLIACLDAAWRGAGLPLRLRPYGVLPTSAATALIEAVPEAVSLHALKAALPPGASLASHFDAAHPRGTAAGDAARRAFVESAAAYSLATHLFAVKDRHNGNILLCADGAIVHIDYGFMLGASPGGVAFEAAPFKLTRELLEVMDSDAAGAPSPSFDAFKARGRGRCGPRPGPGSESTPRPPPPRPPSAGPDRARLPRRAPRGRPLGRPRRGGGRAGRAAGGERRAARGARARRAAAPRRGRPRCRHRRPRPRLRLTGRLAHAAVRLLPARAQRHPVRERAGLERGREGGAGERKRRRAALLGRRALTPLP